MIRKFRTGLRRGLFACSLAAASGALADPAQQRLLALEGGRNFRDVGGYPAADGRQVRWGALYRSGTLYALTERDYALLSERTIAVVADLRSVEEQASEPTRWQAGEVEILSWSYSQREALQQMGKYFSRENLSADDIEELTLEMYRRMPEQQAAHYSAVFDQLADNRVPLLLHCSGGKDRTGLGIALVLTALGVPRDIILEDYALSARYQEIPVLEGEDSKAGADGAHAALAALGPEVLAPLLDSRPEYLENAFAAIEEQHGSVMNYIRGELQVSEEELARLQQNLLEPAAN